MKRSLLFSAAVVAAFSAFAFHDAQPVLKGSDMFIAGPKAPALSASPAALTRASGSIDFSYAGGLYTAYNLQGTVPGTSRVYMMFEMSPEDIKAYAGNQVTAFTVVSPTNENYKNTIASGSFFYTTTFESADYVQDFRFSREGFGMNTVSMDTPYTITGEEETLAFGYSIVVPKNNDLFYLPVDDVPNDNPGSCLINICNEDAFPATGWLTGASVYGALCMSISIEGDNLPESRAVISDVDVPVYLPINGESVDVPFMIRNAAANEVSSVEVTVSMTGIPDIVQTFEFAPLAYNNTAVLTVNGVKGAVLGFGEFSMRITKVNGEERDGVPFVAMVPAYDNGYVTKIVAEDATGTWCGWCPGGIEALDYLKSTYPDRAIAIGVHSGDNMAIDSYQEYVDAYVSGFPNVMYNRTIDQTPTGNYSDVCAYIDEVVKMFDYPSYVEVELSGMTNGDKTAADVTSRTKFIFNVNVPHYLSFVVVEDGVGPYLQQNFFCNKQYRLKMNGWESKESAVPTIYDDVARCYVEFPGIENSLPSEIEADAVNEYSISLPLANVKNNEYRVIALVTNAQTGCIVNACEIEMSKDNDTSGADVFINEDMPAEYYNLNGMKVSDPKGGIFIRKQGAKTEKVIIND